MSNDAITNAVANGAQLLDEKVPGWWKVINLDKLSMGDCTLCILGQLFGHDTEVALGAKMFDLPIDPEKAAWSEPKYLKEYQSDERGYVRGRTVFGGISGSEIGCNIGGDISYSGENYQQLRCAWADIITERRAQDEIAKEEKDGN